MTRARLICGCLLAIAAVGCLYLVSWCFGRGRITHFSPYTLETRSQSEILVPLLGIPIYRSRPETYHYKLVQYLIDNDYWAPTEDKPPSIRTYRWNKQWLGGESELHRDFRWFAESWITWSKEHPDVAAKLWPLVLQFLRSDSDDTRSYAIPLMHIAKHATTASELDQIIKSEPELVAVIAKLK